MYRSVQTSNFAVLLSMCHFFVFKIKWVCLCAARRQHIIGRPTTAMPDKSQNLSQECNISDVNAIDLTETCKVYCQQQKDDSMDKIIAAAVVPSLLFLALSIFVCVFIFRRRCKRE